MDVDDVPVLTERMPEGPRIVQKQSGVVSDRRNSGGLLSDPRFEPYDAGPLATARGTQQGDIGAETPHRALPPAPLVDGGAVGNPQNAHRTSYKLSAVTITGVGCYCRRRWEAGAMTRFGILAVCTGNVHRSPLAAVMIERWARWYLPAELSDRVSVASAGTGAPVGAPMGSRPLAIAAALGADGRAHRATQLSDDALVAADLVLVASRLHRDQVLSQVPSAMRRTFTFREAGRIAERLQPRRLETVADLRAVVAALAEGRYRGGGPGCRG